jgi:hypothetical protein
MITKTITLMAVTKCCQGSFSRKVSLIATEKRPQITQTKEGKTQGIEKADKGRKMVVAGDEAERITGQETRA